MRRGGPASSSRRRKRIRRSRWRRGSSSSSHTNKRWCVIWVRRHQEEATMRQGPQRRWATTSLSPECFLFLSSFLTLSLALFSSFILYAKHLRNPSSLPNVRAGCLRRSTAIDSSGRRRGEGQRRAGAGRGSSRRREGQRQGPGQAPHVTQVGNGRAFVCPGQWRQVERAGASPLRLPSEIPTASSLKH